MIQIRDLGRDYQLGKNTLTVLDGIDFEVADKEFVAITGPSGSGKSTLLGLMAGLDRPTRGSVIISGTDLSKLNEDQLALFRGKHIGFVFQSFQLIPTLTAIENVRVPAELRGDFKTARGAAEMLERVGLEDRLHHFPNQLSGGEMQRVAIARASLTKPEVLLADEPTGNLDSSNGERIMEILRELNQNSTLVLVTHNPELAATTDREICMKDGHIDQVREHR